MKKIRDRLHLYLGNDVRSRDMGIIQPFTTITEKTYSLFESGDFVLCLRKLSDMTDNEIDELASILLGKETHCYHKWRSEDGDCIIAEWKKVTDFPPYDEKYDYMTMGMLISEDFSIKHNWNYHNENGTGVTNEPLHNSHEITKYLLKRGFDIYGLIDDGLAIDASTLK